MSTLDDLRGTLDRHAAELTDHDVHTRPGAVRQRVRVVRRRRAGAGGLAAAVVVAGLVGGLSRLPGDAPTPPEAGRPTHQAAPQPDFPPALGDGSRLIGGFKGGQGDPELKFRVRAAAQPLRWSFYCAPAGSGWFTVDFNGVRRMFGQCGTASGETGSGWGSFDNLERADGRPVAPGDPIDVVIRLYRSHASARLSADPGIRLGAGVYALN